MVSSASLALMPTCSMSFGDMSSSYLLLMMESVDEVSVGARADGICRRSIRWAWSSIEFPSCPVSVCLQDGISPTNHDYGYMARMISLYARSTPFHVRSADVEEA